MIRRHGRTIRLVMMVVDALAALVLLGLASTIRASSDDAWAGLWQVLPYPAPLITAYSLAWVGMLGFQGLYRSRAHWSLGSESAGVIRASVLLGLVTFATLYVIQADEVSRLVLLAILPVQAVAAIVVRLVIRDVLRDMRRRGRNLRHILVIGTGPTAIDFAERLEARWDLGFVVAGLVGEHPLPEGTRWSLRGPIDELPAILHADVIDEVAICLPAADRTHIDAIARLCLDQGKTVRFPLEIPVAALASGHVEDLDGTPVVSIVSGPDRDLALAVKRLVDLGGAVVGLALLGPILAVVGIAIKVSDGGPIFFRQPRAGLNGRPFRIVKFRTMTVDADAQRAALRAYNEVEGHASFKMTNDPRITRIGGALRKTSIDELPQLWNVLRGSMSLVGPRPHPFDDLAGYDDWHRRRLSMKPGITGLWQIDGRAETSFDRWVEKDLEYIDRWSLWLDFRVMVATIPALLRAEGR